MTQKPAIIDTDFLNSIIDNDIEFRDELFLIFKESSSNNLQKMIKSLEDNDFSAWYSASHAFKGASSSIGAFDLANTLDEAQRAIDKTQQEKLSILTVVQQKYIDLVNCLDKITR